MTIPLILCFAAGLLLGFGIRSLLKPRCSGTLKLRKDESDGSAYLFLDLDEEPDMLMQHETVHFHVETEPHNSQAL